MKFYVASATNNPKGGIYIADLEMSSGKILLLDNIADIEYPSFITIDSEGKYLYAVSISENKIYSYLIGHDANSLLLIDSKSINGLIPCYISLTTNNDLLFVVNYTSANCLVIKLKDGIMNISDTVSYKGSSKHKDRQESPHPHSIVPDNNSKFVYVADLGTDKIMIYSINCRNKKINPIKDHYKKLKPGSGPRHFIFYNSNYAYVINELNSTITGFIVDNQTGSISENKTISTIPKNYSGINWAADIHIKGQFLYASNRGHNSIAVFRIEENTGELMHIAYQNVYGDIPRNFAIDPTGEYVLIANEMSNNITCFNRDNISGKLKYTGFSLDVITPQCIKFI